MRPTVPVRNFLTADRGLSGPAQPEANFTVPWGQGASREGPRSYWSVGVRKNLMAEWPWW